MCVCRPMKRGSSGRGRQPAPRRLRIAGEVELIDHLSIQRDRDVGAIDGDLVVIPFADRMRDGGPSVGPLNE